MIGQLLSQYSWYVKDDMNIAIEYSEQAAAIEYYHYNHKQSKLYELDQKPASIQAQIKCPSRSHLISAIRRQDLTGIEIIR